MQENHQAAVSLTRSHWREWKAHFTPPFGLCCSAFFFGHFTEYRHNMTIIQRYEILLSISKSIFWINPINSTDFNNF